MKNFILVSLTILLGTSLGYSQVNTEMLDDIASTLATVGGLDVYGEIFEDYHNSGGVAAIGCRGDYCAIYAHPEAMDSKSENTWAFIMGHELGHYALGHMACGKGGSQAEMDADIVGAELATRAGYNLTGYLRSLQREPNSCSKSHGCWSDRINNLKQYFGYRTSSAHRCNNRSSVMAFPF